MHLECKPLASLERSPIMILIEDMVLISASDSLAKLCGPRVVSPLAARFLAFMDCVRVRQLEQLLREADVQANYPRSVDTHFVLSNTHMCYG